MQSIDVHHDDSASLGDQLSRRASRTGAVQATAISESPCKEPDHVALISFQPSLLRSFARPSAWQGWESIHEQPIKAFVYSVLATLNTILVNTWVLIFASRPLRWSHHALSLAYIAVHTTTLLLVWINGPSIAKTTAYYACFSIAVFIQIGVSARLMLGPDEHVPFRNRLVFELVNAFTQWTWMLASLLGCWAADHPRHPHRSLAPALMNATVRTLRLTDGITDMLVIRLILQHAHEPCFWFGARASCRRWHVMAGCAGVFTSADLALSVFYGMSGSRVGSTGRGSRFHRVYKYTNIVSFMCELGTLIVTMVKLFSSFREPAINISPAERRNSVSLILVSFLITTATFSVTMVGLKRIATAASRVAVGVRSRFSHGSAHSRASRTGHTGQQEPGISSESAEGL